MAAKFSSSDDLDISSSETVFRLCSLDQKNPGSCPPSSCSNLHMCREYLLTNECEIFKLRGKCSHSHSLFTQHNKKVLDKVFKLSANDEDTFDRVAKLIKKSVSNRSSRSDDQDFVSSGDQTGSISTGRGRGQPPVQLRKISSDHPTAGRLSLSSRLPTLTNSDYSQTNSERFSNSLNLDTMKSHHDREKSSTMHSLGAQENDDSSDGSSSKRSSSRHGKSIASTLSSFVSKVKGNLSPKPNRNNAVEIIPKLKYVFDGFNRDDELSYLHGPISRYLTNKNYQIFPSGYCRLLNANQEKEIQEKITDLFPKAFTIDSVQLPNDEYGLFICTSAAERIFEQTYNKDKPYSIISKPYSASLSIEVIRSRRVDSSASSSTIISSRPSASQEAPRLSLQNEKLYISQTKSTIDVIRGDITNILVDVLVCVTTSVTLLNSILNKAGQTTISEYNRLSYSKDPKILSGGSTAAKGILFIPWKFEVESSDSSKAQKSLSNLVQKCIDEAHRLNMRSIAFPSIGTGKIGLDPDKAAESMISAAIECLNRYRMDVFFVIYPISKSSDRNEESYHAFHDYLNALCKPEKAEASSVVRSSGGLTIPIGQSKQINIDRECKRISTLSAPLDMTSEHRRLLASLQKLIEEKTIKLSYVQRQFADHVESIIDQCLDYHVIPCIDYVKDELTVRGDRDSCSQCLFNLQNQPKIHKYLVCKKTTGRPEKIDVSMHVSMKIDEAFTNGEESIIIRDGSDTMLHVDLENYNMKINDDPQQFGLEREELNIDRRINRPSTWSSTSLMIRTIDVLGSPSALKKPLHLFEKTMPSTEWHVDRIDAIENWPLYVHCNGSEINDETFAFHGCSYSSVQSIIHYGLHSNFGRRTDDFIRLNYNAFDSHVQNACRSTTGQYYMFLVRSEKRHFNNGSAKLSNDNAHLALPTHLIVYRRWTDAK